MVDATVDRLCPSQNRGLADCSGNDIYAIENRQTHAALMQPHINENNIRNDASSGDLSVLGREEISEVYGGIDCAGVSRLRADDVTL